jgi:hypothetical protein
VSREETRRCYNCGEVGHLIMNYPRPLDKAAVRQLAAQHGGHLEKGRWCFSIQADEESEEEQEEDGQGYTTGPSDSDSYSDA